MAEINKLKNKKSWNKTDLTILLANQADIPKVRAAEYINILTDTISEALGNGKKVTISDFGTFQVSERRSFNGRNPKTGAPILVPVRRIPVFRAGKYLKHSLNTPQIRECTLINSKKLRVTFSKLMDADFKSLTAKSAYNILIDDKKVKSIKSIKIENIEEESRPNQMETLRVIKGVRSVIITTSSSLLCGSDLQVELNKPLLDVDGNYTE